MGLDTTHGCWHGAYTAFRRWRNGIAQAAGMPPLGLMEGYYGWGGIEEGEVREAQDAIGWDTKHEWARELFRAIAPPPGFPEAALPIQWECLRPSPLHILLRHSDCDGSILTADCGPIADALEELLPRLPDDEGGGHIGNWREKTETFIAGLRLAASLGEDVGFH